MPDAISQPSVMAPSEATPGKDRSNWRMTMTKVRPSAASPSHRHMPHQRANIALGEEGGVLRPEQAGDDRDERDEGQQTNDQGTGNHAVISPMMLAERSRSRVVARSGAPIGAPL